MQGQWLVFLLCASVSAAHGCTSKTEAHCLSVVNDSALIQRNWATTQSSKDTLDSASVGQTRGGVRTFMWSNISARCATGTSNCILPSGETWILDQSMDVGTLSVEGRLIWDTNSKGLELRACGISVEHGGTFEVGSASGPMNEKATIYIKKCARANAAASLTRYLVGRGNARVELHGRPLERTFTLLSQTATTGAVELYLKHDPVQMGWRVNDRIGVATTGGPNGWPVAPLDGSTRHRITAISGMKIFIDPPLTAEHLGGFTTFAGDQYEMAAEVVNMERTVLITGDHDDFFDTGQGLHTMMMPSENGDKFAYGVMDVRYVRVEYCGQLDVVGRYCLHFHMMKHCPKCTLLGNAVVDSFQAGITVHGTHDSLVDQNVLWDNRGVGIHIEDGNEMNNTISNNVIICSSWNTERNDAMCVIEWQGGFHQHGGIYAVGKTNHLIANHVAGWSFSIFAPSVSFGHGQAEGKVCPVHMKLGEVRDNVAHNNGRSGIYLDNQYPRNLEVDEDGYVIDLWKCWEEFLPDGQDNGATGQGAVVYNEFEFYNGAGAVHYSLGDIGFHGLRSVQCGNTMYWKRGKNFANGKLATKHVENGAVVNGWYLLPGGPFTFWMKDVKLVGWSSIQFPQHGFNPTMSVQVVLEGMDYSGSTATTRLRFGSSGGNPVTVIYLSRDQSLGGHHALVSRFLNGFASVNGCIGPLEELWDRAYGCDSSVPVRRLNIWSPDMGTLKLTGPGYNVAPVTYPEADIWNTAMYAGSNAGNMHYDSEFTRGGYATPVIAGETYTIEGLEWHGDVVFEFSDQLAEEYFGEPEVVHLKLITPQGTVDCTVRADADRKFLAKGVPEGLLPDAAWDLGDCGTKFRQVTGQPVRTTPKTRPPLTQLTWALHEAHNCYHGVGAESARGGALGERRLTDCKMSCERDWDCEGVIVVHDSDPTACFTLKNIAIDSCAKGGGYDLWRLEPSGEMGEIVPTSAPRSATTTTTPMGKTATTQVPTATNTPAPTRAASSPVTNPGATLSPIDAPMTPADWTRYEGLNCYGGRGADAAAGDWIGSLTLAACKDACRNEVECEGIIVVDGQDPGSCWLRKNINPPECYSGSPFDLWMHSVADSTSMATPSSEPVPSPASTAPVSTQWVYHKGLNCFSGVGADIAPGDYKASMHLSACKHACSTDAQCEGIIVVRDDEPGPCWLRMNIDTSACWKDTVWDLWMLSTVPIMQQ